MSAFSFYHKNHLSAEALAEAYQRIEADRLLFHTIWYDGEPPGLLGWANYLREQWFAVCYADDGEQVGCFWLNGYQGRAAQIHFAIFESGRPAALDIGRATVGWLRELDWLHSLYGITPAPYRHVFPFIQALGFQVLGRLPGACWMDRKQKYVDGVVSVLDLKRG